MINFIDALAGSGKTHAVIEMAVEKVKNGDCVLMVQPTIKLCDRTAAMIRQRGGYVRVINTDTARHPLRAICAEFRSPHPEGQILLITTAAFLQLQFIPNRNRWCLIVDEPPQSFEWFESPRVDCGALLRIVHLQKHPDADLHVAHVLSRVEARSLIAETGNIALRGLCHRLLNGNFSSYLTRGTKDDEKALHVLSVLKSSVFDGFRSVLIVSALFKGTFLYKHLSNRGIVLTPDVRIMRRLRYSTHENGGLVKIIYAIDEPWSKWVRDNPELGMMKRLRELASSTFGDKPFLLSVNKDKQEDVLLDMKSAILLPHRPHGINDYSQVDNVMILSAYNPTPSLAKALGAVMALTPDEIKTSMNHEQCYQAIMRCSIRNPESKSMKTIIVPDAPLAQFLLPIFPGCTVEKVDVGLGNQAIRMKPGRKKVYDSGTARQRAFADRQREASRARFQEIVSSHSNIPPNEMTLIDMYIVRQFFGCEFPSKQSVGGTLVMHHGVSQFESDLRERSANIYTDKDKVPLMSSAVFDGELSEVKFRGRDNVVFTTGVFLDFERGSLMPDDFACIFPQLRFTAYATWSSTKSSVRFRIYIPSDSTMKPVEHMAAIRAIRDKMIDSGFKAEAVIDGEPAHGLDPTKHGPEALFRLPCRPSDPDGAFFKVYKGRGRKPLVVADWVAESTQPPSTVFPEPTIEVLRPVVFCNGSVDPERAACARAEWQAVGCLPGNGNEGLFKLGRELTLAGLPHAEVEAELLLAANMANSPEDRTRQVPGIMASLQRYQHSRGSFANTASANTFM